MHPDHIGGLINEDGSKVFENATLSISEMEWNGMGWNGVKWGFMHSDEVRNAAPKEFRSMIDVARIRLAPYADGKRMFNGEEECLPASPPYRFWAIREANLVTC